MSYRALLTLTSSASLVLTTLGPAQELEPQDADQLTLDVGGGGDIMVGSLMNRFDVFNITAALQVDFGRYTSVRIGGSAPARVAPDRFFEAEFSVQVIIYGEPWIPPSDPDVTRRLDECLRRLKFASIKMYAGEFESGILSQLSNSEILLKPGKSQKRFVQFAGKNVHPTNLEGGFVSCRMPRMPINDARQTDSS